MIQAITDGPVYLRIFNVFNRLLQLVVSVCPSCGGLVLIVILQEFLIVILYYFYGALDKFISGQKST